MIGAIRRWAKQYNEDRRYTPVGIAFHWIMAALVIFQLGWGYYMTLLPAGGDKLLGYQVHSAVGLPILGLGLARFVWRMIVPGPINDADDQGWQTVFAEIIHWVFYACFFGLPLTGWVMWSSVAEPGPLYLGGVIPWPQMPFDMLDPVLRWQIMDIAEDIHLGFVTVLLLVVPLHVGAALKHHFWDRHDVLKGMLPQIPDAEDPQEAPPHRPRHHPSHGG